MLIPSGSYGELSVNYRIGNMLQKIRKNPHIGIGVLGVFASTIVAGMAMGFSTLVFAMLALCGLYSCLFFASHISHMNKEKSRKKSKRAKREKENEDNNRKLWKRYERQSISELDFIHLGLIYASLLQTILHESSPSAKVTFFGIVIWVIGYIGSFIYRILRERKRAKDEFMMALSNGDI